MAHPQIAAFARLANGDDAPVRLIAGQRTKLSRTMHDIRYDAIHDEFFVSNPFAQAILTFRGAANGEEPPVRIIQGPHTQLQTPDVLDVDPIHNEIFVPDTRSIRVYRRDAQGDAAPLRTLHFVSGSGEGGVAQGDAAPLRFVSGSGEGGVAVDPVHNVLVTAGMVMGPTGKKQAALFIFNRTDQGSAKPKAIITGPKTGLIATRQLRIYAPGGWIVATQITSGALPEPPKTFVGVWSIHDNGDVPPRWRIDGNPGNVMKKPRGVALDPRHKTIIVSDMRLNAVLTFYLPEMYQQPAQK